VRDRPATAPIVTWVVGRLDERLGWTLDLPDRTRLIAVGLIIP
jgi:hypothetical protein